MPRLLKREDIVQELVEMKVKQRASNATILEHLKTKYGYKQTFCYELLKEARKIITVIWNKDAAEEIEISKGQLEQMLEEARNTGEKKLELEIRKELNKLQGLYSPDKIDISIVDKVLHFKFGNESDEPKD